MAFAYPVETVEEAMTYVATLSKEYFDARHVCYAYMIGHERNIFRANDNGEPSGTAGKPILGQINSFQLTNIVIVVVRYFGGIKLGTPGLISAYRQAAHDVIETSVIVERHVTKDIMFTFPYLVMNDVMKLTRQPSVQVLSVEYDNTCSMTVRVELDYVEVLQSRLCNIDGVIIMDF